MSIQFSSEDILNYLSTNPVAQSDHKPNFLLKFYSPKNYNFESVRDEKIFLSNPIDFNDPYDCRLTFNHDALIKRKLIDWICSSCKNLERNKLREGAFDWTDLDLIYHTRDTSPIHHRDDYTDTIEDALSSILLNKDSQFSKTVKNQIRQILILCNGILREFDEYVNIGVSCFCNCENNYNIDQTNLMWSHYAMNHKGFCVMYCFDENVVDKAIDYKLFRTFQPVKYTKHRVFIPKMVLLRHLRGQSSEQDRQTVIDKVSKSLLTKSTVWKYEGEWRLICNKVNETISFPYAAAIFIGCRAQKNVRKKLNEIAEDLKIPIFQTELDSRFYRLNNFDTEQVYRDLLYR